MLSGQAPRWSGVWTKVRWPLKLPVCPEWSGLGGSPWGPRMERPLRRLLVALAFRDGVPLGR